MQIDLTARNGDYSVYIPSMQLGSASNVRMEASEWKDDILPPHLEPKDFDYLRHDNKYWTYKYALASAETFKGRSKNAVSSRDPKAFILGDSGGFQIGKGTFGEAKKWRRLSGKNVCKAWRSSDMRDEIIKWCELNCTYAMTIDIPLWVNREAEKNSPFRKLDTDTLIQLSVENLAYLQDVRGKWGASETPCKYLSVLQGDTEAAEQRWYDAVKGYKFDGWSFAGGVGVNGGPYRILKRLLTMADDGLLDDGYDWLHLLMLGKLRWAPFVTAIQRGVRRHNPKFTISYDSSTAYKMGGKFEQYYASRELTDDKATWSQKPIKLPSTWGYANSSAPIMLCETICSGPVKCSICETGDEHLKAALDSPIARTMSIQELLTVKDKKAVRRGGKLFEETITNNNVFVIVDGMIRANEAVFVKNTAPQQLIDACGLVGQLFEKNENWHSLLLEHRGLFEKALGFKAPKYALE